MTSASKFIYREIKRELSEGWITMNGTHVEVGDDGTIEKGPDKFVGKNLDKEDDEVEVTNPNGTKERINVKDVRDSARNLDDRKKKVEHLPSLIKPDASKSHTHFDRFEGDLNKARAAGERADQLSKNAWSTNSEEDHEKAFVAHINSGGGYAKSISSFDHVLKTSGNFRSDGQLKLSKEVKDKRYVDVRGHLFSSRGWHRGESEKHEKILRARGYSLDDLDNLLDKYE